MSGRPTTGPKDRLGELPGIPKSARSSKSARPERCARHSRRGGSSLWAQGAWGSLCNCRDCP
eukprot:4691559-Pyramimonas_sp.AAC.1